MTREQEMFVSELADDNESVRVLELSSYADAPILVKIPNGASWVVEVDGTRLALNPAIKLVVAGEEF